jgi:two-component system cell cycle response regulator
MPEKILVVDDEEDVRLLLSEYLSAEGFKVLTAENGVEGIRLFRDESPDLVIADIKMPVRSGIDLLNDIKTMSDDVEVIILTGHSDEATAIQCLRQGAYDYLLKPIEELEVLCASVQRALQKRQLGVKNMRLLKELEQMAIQDPLTGLYNHRHLDKCLRDEVVRSTRYNHNFLVIMADIDHFKKINDTHGHLFGDFVLKRMARLLADSLRLTDTIFRYGGEEFLLLLPETRKNQAVRIAERILESVRYHDFNCEASRAQITLSMGAAEFPVEASDCSGLIGLADRRLYRAKQAGRDCFFFETRT